MKSKGVFLAAILGAVLCTSGNLFAVLSGGGTQTNPYLIQSRADFDEFANPANSAIYWAVGVYTKLMYDPNLSDTTYTQAPIAPDTDIDNEIDEFQGVQFTGIFDGNGHVVSNLTITEPEKDFIGLFGAVGIDGQVKSLGLENVNITGRNYAGGLMGYNDGALTGCHVAGSVSGGSDVGGMMGRNGSGTLASCYATGSVSGTNGVGGLVGWINNGTLTGCYATGSVSGNSGVGGMVGGCDGASVGITLTSCYATGPVIATDSYAGGLVGNDYSCTLTECYATGSVTSNASAGGLVGWDSFGTLTNCYATGQVTATSSYAGGLIGTNYSSPITNCHATGSVIGGSYAGGLVGYNYGTLISCDSSSSVSGTGDYVGGLVGYNYNGTLINCYATGSAIGTTKYIGGLVGMNYGMLTSCYATGSVGGTSSCAGGLVGDSHYSSLTDCYATGLVGGTNYVGGLVGESHYSSLTDCYATGLVGGNSYVGGLVGWDYSDTFTGCFWDINTSRTSDGVGNVDPDPAGVTGKTTAQMKTLSTFTDAGWDFVTTDGDPADWMMLRPGEDYPRLAWQTIIAGDIAGSYGVNFIDYAVLAAHWRQTGCPSGCGNADINNDGTVDFNDLKLFANNWLAGI